jgi:hypothetical protein
MNISRQTRDAIILALLMTVLVIVGVLQFRGTSAPPSPPPPRPGPVAKPAPVSADKEKGKAPPKAAPGGPQVGWVDTMRVPRLVAEVTGGRDPFRSYLPGVATGPRPVPPPVIQPRPTGRTGNPIIPQPMDTGLGRPGSAGGQPPAIEREYSLTKTLEWITPDVVI